MSLPFDLRRAILLDKYMEKAEKTRNTKLKKRILLEMKKMKYELEKQVTNQAQDEVLND